MAFTNLKLAISGGWTTETFRIQCYETLDRIFLRYADKVVAVSYGQQAKILRAGVPERKVQVIHNAINLDETVVTRS